MRNDLPTNRVMTDLLFLVLIGFLAIIILMIPWINPKAKKDLLDPPPQGNVAVQLFWMKGASCDVDLWVKAPNDVPVGYSNKSGKIFSLLRDDIGQSNDVSDDNMEISYSRGVPDGEWIVNIHLYNQNKCRLPIQVRVEVGMKADENSAYKPLFFKTVSLTHQGQELTVMRWELSNKKVVEGSEHSIPIKLRSAIK